MKYKQLSKFELKLLDINIYHKWFNLISLLVTMPIIYFMVYITGGVKFVFSHTMYIPIVYAGFTLGAKYGLLTGIIGGILLGPLMPLDTINNESQLTINWIYRLVIFSFIGILSGFISDLLKKNVNIVKTMYSSNQETNIPNSNSLSNYRIQNYDSRTYVVISILVNNNDNIVDLLGSDIYYSILNKVYQNLKKSLPDNSVIVQSDSNKFWLSMLHNNLFDDINLVLSLLNQQINISNIPIYVEFSLGINTVKNYESCLCAETYKKSDISARYAQKNNLPYIIFDEKLLSKREDFELISMFSKALEMNQTKLVFQPKIDLKTNKPIGLEALIRWDHPVKCRIMPDKFISLVEETQLIHSLTDWVLKHTILKAEEFQKENIDIHISINISAKNLIDFEFFNRVLKLIKQSKIKTSQIEFEITESALMINPEDSKTILKQFKEEGFVITLDDFGKGYSSLAYLSDFSFQIIKIDQYFIRRISYDQSVKSIVQSTIDLAHQLGCKVVAEGIADEMTAKIVKSLNCDYAQGYYFSRPIEDEEIIKWYKKVEIESYVTV